MRGRGQRCQPLTGERSGKMPGMRRSCKEWVQLTGLYLIPPVHSSCREAGYAIHSRRRSCRDLRRNPLHATAEQYYTFCTPRVCIVDRAVARWLNEIVYYENCLRSLCPSGRTLQATHSGIVVRDLATVLLCTEKVCRKAGVNNVFSELV